MQRAHVRVSAHGCQLSVCSARVVAQFFMQNPVPSTLADQTLPCAVPEKFEEIFTKHDRGNKGGLDASDIARMIWANRCDVVALVLFHPTYVCCTWPTCYAVRCSDALPPMALISS